RGVRRVRVDREGVVMRIGGRFTNRVDDRGVGGRWGRSEHSPRTPAPSTTGRVSPAPGRWSGRGRHCPLHDPWATESPPGALWHAANPTGACAAFERPTGVRTATPVTVRAGGSARHAWSSAE